MWFWSPISALVSKPPVVELEWSDRNDQTYGMVRVPEDIEVTGVFQLVILLFYTELYQTVGSLLQDAMASRKINRFHKLLSKFTGKKYLPRNSKTKLMI